ncbi:6-phosphogluconolactonase [Prochlorococcus sp. MIT 1300]|uniref:6-phosphogluconolactonase n=1 Tax=Prochlorococcus sp. MIT 1300 TaxID=3096218 RepID=UPI002A74C56A|nr:6-phosphogluconolactonase [Prochlorococcus sp. MIT 1300]
MASYHLEKATNSDDFARRAAETIASYIDLALDQRDRAQIALCGGSTPQLAYSFLGEEHIPWDRVDIFLGDERWVDPLSETSNALMIKRTLLSGGLASKAVFNEVPTIDLPSPKDSAKAYASLIEKTCLGNPPLFDLTVLGLGTDGHTASLFPGTDSLNVKNEWVTVGNGNGMKRITLTEPVLSASRKVIFLVAGSNKKTAIRRLMDPNEPPSRTPGRLVNPTSEILVLADQFASEGL